MEEVKRKRGRPKTGVAKENEIHIRLSDEDLEKLQYVCYKEGKTMTDVVLDGINGRYNIAKFT